MTFHDFFYSQSRSARHQPQTFGPRDPGQRPTKAQGTKATKATAQAAQAEARLTSFFLVGHNGPGLRLGGWPWSVWTEIYILYIYIYIYIYMYMYVYIYI